MGSELGWPDGAVVGTVLGVLDCFEMGTAEGTLEGNAEG